MPLSQNTITACIEFSFQGKDYAYTSILNLDRLLHQYHELPALYPIMATQHGIDTYSYLYEVMQEADIEFIEPRGYAADYVSDGEFSIIALAEHWQERKASVLLQPIALRELGIENIDNNQPLKRALIAAYQLGRGV